MEPVEEVLDEGSLDRLYNLTVGFWEPTEIFIKVKGEVAHGVELHSWGAKAPPFTSGAILRIVQLMKGGALAPQERSSAPCATPPIFQSRKRSHIG